MKVNANHIRPGNIIDYKQKLWRVTKIAHTQPGKGGAYIQMELKGLTDGIKLNDRFRSSEDVEKVRLDEKEMQYLFMDETHITLMDKHSYEQIEIHRDILDEQVVYLQDEMDITLLYHEQDIISAVLPETVELEVAETEAVVKGQTAASSNKPASMENGVRVMVPPFIEVGDRLLIRTSDGAYMERVKIS